MEIVVEMAQQLAKLRKKYNVSRERLKLAVESEKKGGVNNLSDKEVHEIAKALAKK